MVLEYMAIVSLIIGLRNIENRSEPLSLLFYDAFILVQHDFLLHIETP